MKMLTVSLFGLLLWGNSHMAAADAACEGRFVNPITDICWRCMFPCRSAAQKSRAGIYRTRPIPVARYSFVPCHRRYFSALARQ